MKINWLIKSFKYCNKNHEKSQKIYRYKFKKKLQFSCFDFNNSSIKSTYRLRLSPVRFLIIQDTKTYLLSKISSLYLFFYFDLIQEEKKRS